MRRTESGQWLVTTIYLSQELADAIEQRRDKLEEQHPGMRVTLSDVMRNAISRGLEGADEE
jgi:hypothetical protein